MCMIDNSDGYSEILSETDPLARKPHKCHECYRVIEPGERYHCESLLFEGRVSRHKTCQHCMVARGWLLAECGGWLYSGVPDDIHEHAANGYGAYPMSVLRLAVGMRRKWRRRSGDLMPVPAMPPTTHDRDDAARKEQS